MTQMPQPQPEEPEPRAAAQPAPPPAETGMRIGGVERDDAISLLQEHLAAGRLDSTEFDDRIGKALSAKTGTELDGLFSDLPGRRPGQSDAGSAPSPYGQQQANPYGASPYDTSNPYGANPGQGAELANPYGESTGAASPYSATPPQQRHQQFHWMAPGVLVPIAVVLCFILGWHLWFLIPIAAIVGSQMSYHGGRRRHRDRRQLGQQSAPPALRQLGSEDAARITDLLHEGKKVHAVKAYREATGADLVTAKNAIDNWGETLR